MFNNLKIIIAAIGVIGFISFSILKLEPGRDFNPNTYELTTPSGPITLAQLKSNKKIVILYFGFLTCPEACPTTLSLMSKVFRELTQDQRDKISFLFIDVDPERDTMEDMITYTNFFDKKITPVLIPLADLQNFTYKFGISVYKMPIESSMSYTIDHTTDMIVIAPTGEILQSIEHGQPKVVVLDRIRKVLNKFGDMK